MYFDNFPVIPYDSVGKGYFKDVTNLLRRVGVRAKVKTNTMLFDTYDVKEGETPESIADKLYDDPELHWVILLVNNIADRYHQWPMNTPQFQSYVTEKYANPDATHHYEITQDSGDTDTKIEIYNPDKLGKPLGLYKHITRVKASEFLFIAGQLSVDRTGNIIGENNFEVQMKKVFSNIREALLSAGTDFKDVVKFTTFLKSESNIEDFMRIR